MTWVWRYLVMGVVGAAMVSGCLSPTEFRVVLDTDVDCAKVGTVDIVATGVPGPIGPSASAVATSCQSGRLGDVVLVPGNKENALLVQVVAGFEGTATADCLAAVGGNTLPKGCVVARRIVRYVDHASLALPITLYGKCGGVQCDSRATCDASGDCVPAATTCTAGGCTAPRACDAGLIVCGGECVDVQSSAANCGGCGLACPSGCNAGRCVVTLATGQASPTAIKVDANNVYWTSSGDPNASASVMKAPINGGPPTLVAGQQGKARSLFLANNTLYWSTNSTPGAVMTAPINGGVLGVIASAEAQPIDVAADATHAYWVGYGDGNVRSAASGGSPMTIVSGQGNPSSIAVDSTSVYWTASTDGTVLKASLGGGNVVPLASSQARPTAIVVDAANVYWATTTTVAKTSLVGGSAIVLGAANAPAGVTVDSQFVYWTNTIANGSLMKTPLAGGAAITLASGLATPWGVAVDATSVYWTNSSDGTVMKLTPK